MSPVAIAVVVLAVVGVGVLLVYNRLVRLRNRCEQAWADIDVYATRRHELIPNLVETVRAYAAHERELFVEVTRARSAGVAARTAAEQAGAEQQVEAALDRLFAVAEAYPQLRADERFRALADELVATENKLAFSRQLYNDTVTAYQTATQSFPGLLLAGPLGFTPPALFEVEPGAHQAVAVRLRDGAGEG